MFNYLVLIYGVISYDLPNRAWNVDIKSTVLNIFPGEKQYIEIHQLMQEAAGFILDRKIHR